MHRRGWGVGLLVAATAALALASLAGCDRNAGNPLLTPTGERPQPQIGVFQGTLDFGGAFPRALILMARVTDPNCVSVYNTIQVVGTNTDPVFDVGTAPFLTEVASCVWMDTLTIPQGEFRWKFVTDGVFDSPPDYSTADGSQEDGLENVLAFAGPGSADLTATVSAAEAGFVVGILNESTDPPTYRYLPMSEAPAGFSSTADGSFAIRDLELGTYDVRIEAPGFFPLVLEGVTITENPLDLGQVTMIPSSGALLGTVSYEGDPQPRPETTIDVRMAGDSQILASATTDSAYSFAGLQTGSYDLDFDAPPGFLDTTIANVAFTNGQNTDLGDVRLRIATVCVSEFGQIQMAGDFQANDFDLATAPQMTEISPCVWEVTVTLPAGATLFKLVTDGNFDNPQDYGGDETAIPIPGTFPTSLVSGFGTAIQVQASTPGDYTVTLDEQALTITMALAGGGPGGAIRGTVEHQGVTRRPANPALVEVFDGPTRVGVANADSATGFFQIDGIDPGSYRVTVNATCFQEVVRDPVNVADAPVDLGTLSLPAGTSPHATIAVAGDFNGFTLDSLMTEGPSCIWTYTFQEPLAAGVYNLKLVTDGAFDSPPDYGGDETNVLVVPSGGSLETEVKPVSGSGTALRIDVQATDTYRMILDERVQYLTIEPTSAAGDGGITGQLSFSGVPSAPFAPATVRVFSGATEIASTTSDRQTGRFTVGGLDPGTYRVTANANCFVEAENPSVSVGPDTVDAGMLALAADVSPHATISLAADFNGFTLDSLMTEFQSCRWSYETSDTIPAGTYNLKFVTDGAFDSPLDYGGDETTVFPAPGNGQVSLVSGPGTAIRVEVTNPSRFRFILDERRQIFVIQAITSAAERFTYR